jgi:hypothetical protein
MSPVVFRHRGYRFQFYANEGNPREPTHIHMVYNDGFDARTIRQMIPIIEAQRGTIETVWNDFFGEAD